MGKNAVIFDLDGTLWDSCDTVALAWNEYCVGHGIDRVFTADECRRCCGKTLQQIAEIIFPELEKARREEILLGCCLAENPPLSERGGVLYPDLIQVLEELKKTYFLAVVSNCQEGYIEAFFTGNRTGYLFDDAENAGRTGLSKAENIRLVIERNGVDRAVYVGDTDSVCCGGCRGPVHSRLLRIRAGGKSGRGDPEFFGTACRCGPPVSRLRLIRIRSVQLRIEMMI